jgi:chromosome segregation ATPase
MGVERAVTRWHIQRQRITDEITTLEAKLAQIQAEQQSPGSAVEIEKRLASLQAKLRTLGPCPKPMMG